MTPEERAKKLWDDTLWGNDRQDFVETAAAAIRDAVAETPPSHVRPEVWRFALAMEKRLRANDHKGGWQDCDQDYLLTRLRQEMIEFWTEIHYPIQANCQIDKDKLREESADVANFLMMILDVEGALA